MGSLLTLPTALLNLVLPFTNPSTPLAQDLVHTLIICGTLYFAPQLVELYNTRFHHDRDTTLHHIPELPDIRAPDAPNEDLPLDEHFILQPDEDEDVGPPPLAPTPPPGQNQAQAGPANWAGQGQGQGQQERHAEPVEEPQARAGPANERPRPTPANRTVGAKKAKSLARKDQRRAYHEFHRQEAELRRQREAAGKEEREAALAAEKARRAEAERMIQEKERQERERKKEEERRTLEEERLRRDRVVSLARQELNSAGSVDLVAMAVEEDKDQVWIERLVRASGLLSQFSRDGAYSMITSAGWAVRVDAQLMRDVYAEAVMFGDTNDGRVNFEELGGILENAVRARAAV